MIYTFFFHKFLRLSIFICIPQLDYLDIYKENGNLYFLSTLRSYSSMTQGHKTTKGHTPCWNYHNLFQPT